MKQRLQSLNNYLWNTGNTVSEMRLLIEGAVVLFEEDALPLTKLAHTNGEHQAALRSTLLAQPCTICASIFASYSRNIRLR